MTQRGSWLRAIWAALISLPFPGLGHVYARRWRLGVILLLVLVVMAQLVLRAGTRLVAPTPAAVAVFVAVVGALLVVQLGVVVDAARRVRGGLVPERPRWFRSTWFTALAVVSIMVVVSGLLPLGWRSFWIPSTSMAPNLAVGDYLMAYTAGGTPVARGNVVVFTTDGGNEPNALFIKRVVALPGDRVALDQDGVILNGARLPHSPGVPSTVDTGTALAALRFDEQLAGHTYPVVQLRQSPESAAMPEMVVPPGTLFVLGDNRNNSLDSRFKTFPPVRFPDLVGIAGTIYWSRDPARRFTMVP